MDAFVTRKRPRDSDLRQKSNGKRDPSISPPPKRNAPRFSDKADAEPIDLTDIESPKSIADVGRPPAAEASPKVLPSPVQLNFVKDLPSSNNVDTIKLNDVLGDPMIKECWLFNYLFDIDFIMSQFDPDVRDAIRIRVVHGSWKAEDRNGIGIIDGARRYSNIQIVKAYMPEAYGTHHSKMIVLFRHDELAQVSILTGNFIERDWSMSQAIWRSPLLPLTQEWPSSSPTLPSLGSGPRFKHDLLAHFRGYGPEKLRDLVNQLQRYDFSEVRGALIASLPGKQNIQSIDPDLESLWGWPALKRILNCIPSFNPVTPNLTHQPHVIAQVSSVAAVGEKWLKDTFIPALSTSQKSNNPQLKMSTPPSKISLVFPTPDEIRRCVDGYSAGASIHMKTSSATQVKQLDILRPMLCHWAGDQKPSKASFFGGKSSIREAGRRRAAPHIKTYVRFSDATSMDGIDWAMVTSANLSTQAWGGALTPGGEVRICSYEIGVVVWPALWDSEDKPGSAEVVPTFKRDTPALERKAGIGEQSDSKRVIGFRMPYDLPLVPYAKDEMPWSAELPYSEPDWKGQVWPGYEK